MKTTWATLPLHELQTVLNMLMLWFKSRVTDIVNKSDISCGSSYSSSARTSDIMEFVQGGCQSSLQMNTTGHAWKCACNFCSDIMKEERLSCNELSQVMKHGCITMNLQANVKAWCGNTHHHPGHRNSSHPSDIKVMLTLGF